MGKGESTAGVAPAGRSADRETGTNKSNAAEENNKKGDGGRKKRRRRKKTTKEPPKKMTKEERRAKYTKLARDRRDRRLAERKGKNLVCFRCRKHGHAASDCTAEMEAGGGGHAGEGVAKVCYKCGSTEHGLHGCPQMKKAPKSPSGRIDYSKVELPYAKCYVCGEMGHLASQCEKNKDKGIFVHGGSCRHCASKLHIAADCPENRKDKDRENKSDDDVAVDDLLEEEDKRVSGSAKKKKKSKENDSSEKGTKKRRKKVVNF